MDHARRWTLSLISPHFLVLYNIVHQYNQQNNVRFLSSAITEPWLYSTKKWLQRARESIH